MILIITHKEDYTVDFVVNKLNEKRIPYYRFNTEDLLSKEFVDIFIDDRRLFINFSNLNSIKSVWFRRIKIPHFEHIPNSVNKYIHNELRVYFSNLWELLEAKWLSIPKFIYRAENKFLQLNEARKIGFEIPSTLISYDPNRINKFFNDNNGDVIVKPIFNNEFKLQDKSKHIYTNKIDRNQIDKISEYFPLPSIFQSYIEKEIEVRITVVENQIFSAYVDSQSSIETSIDWRRKRNKFYEINLPESIKEKCVQLVKKLNLSFGAIDMIKTKEGKFVFLEINPNGQWGWIELETQLPISDSIIEFLKN